MVQELALPPLQADAVNTEIGPSKFCPGCGHGMTLNTLGFAIDELELKKKSRIWMRYRLQSIGMELHVY